VEEEEELGVDCAWGASEKGPAGPDGDGDAIVGLTVSCAQIYCYLDKYLDVNETSE
jgi:hypothetical protein